MELVDLHCHLLWNVDDGCCNADEALEIARTLVTVGYTQVAATPHTHYPFPGMDAAVCRSAFEKLQALLADAKVPLKLHFGAENLLDDAFIDRISKGERRGLGETERYVLVELPFQGRMPALPDVVFRLNVKGVSPVFAHPERCEEFAQRGRAEELVRLGASLQLDLAALNDGYGREARKLAERFLEEGLYSFAATDLHNPRGARKWLGDALSTLEKRVGSAELERICATNPARALRGEDLT